MSLGKLWFVIYVWFLFMCGSCLCSRFVDEKNCLKVSSPEYLKNTYKCAIGNFSSVPQYAGTISGIVVYPKANQKACESFTPTFKSNTPGRLPVFLLVDRGDCHVMFKAWNAQAAGAAAILIVNDRPDSSTTMYLPEEEEVGNYYSQNIAIPLALISRSLGYSMKIALNNNDFVRVNLEWTEAFGRIDEQVEYEVRKTRNDDYGRPRCDDQIQEQHEQVEIRPMWRFMIKPTPFWGFLMRHIWSWFTRL